VINKVGFIGGGNMAGSLIGGLISAGNSAGSNSPAANDIAVFEPNDERAQQLKDQFSVNIAESNHTLVENCDVVVLAVKPQVLQTVLEPLADSFKQSKPLIVSIVAGIRGDSIEQWLGEEYAVVRVMPNTPALVGAGASGLYANQRVSGEQKALTELLLNVTGISVWVNSEADIDTVTALSGSGPAYFMLFIQSLVEAAEAAGLDADTAKQLAVATASGAARLIDASEDSISTLIKNVTSPGGTTEQALVSFDNSKLNDVVLTAFEAARRRSETLAEELGAEMLGGSVG